MPFRSDGAVACDFKAVLEVCLNYTRLCLTEYPTTRHSGNMAKGSVKKITHLAQAFLKPSTPHTVSTKRFGLLSSISCRLRRPPSASATVTAVFASCVMSSAKIPRGCFFRLRLKVLAAHLKPIPPGNGSWPCENTTTLSTTSSGRWRHPDT